MCCEQGSEGGDVTGGTESKQRGIFKERLASVSKKGKNLLESWQQNVTVKFKWGILFHALHSTEDGKSNVTSCWMGM